MHIKDTICFLCKQQIFSPGLLTRPVLITSVAENGGGWMGGGAPIIFLSFSLSFFFAPNLFFTHAAICQRKEVNCVNIAGWKDASFTFNANNNFQHEHL